MPAPLLDLVAATLCLYVAWAPLRRGFVVVAGSMLLLPATLVVPNGVTGLLTVHRVVLVAFLLRLVVDTARGRLPALVWRVTPVHLAFAVFLGVVLVTGVMLAAPGVPVGVSQRKYLDLVEQALVLLACLAVVRADDDASWFLRPLAVIALLSSGIAVVEHFTEWSWGQWLFSRLPSQRTVEAAADLARRGGEVRVRAGAEYPLGFAWVSVALLPAVLLLALSLRRRVTLAVLAAALLVLLGVYWSYSRSALAGLVVVAVVLALAPRNPRLALLVSGASVALVALFVALPAVSHHFASSVDAGSISVRGQRLPAVLAAVADRPLTGLGLGGIGLLGLHATDATYLLSYAETGALGLAALTGLLLVTLVAVGRGLLAVETRTRLAAGAAVAGVLVMIVSGFAFDALSLLGSADVLWVLVAVGVGVGEAARGVVPARVLRPRHALVPIAAVGVGFAVVALAPAHHAVEYRFSTLPVAREAGGYDPVETGTTLINTTCGIARSRQVASGARLDCREAYTGPGIGTLRVEAADADRVTAAAAAVRDAARRAGVAALELIPVTVDRPAQATAVRTAPAWLPVLALMTLLLPSVRRRRARARHAAAPYPRGT